LEKLDVAIIGAGVIGLAIGRAFALAGREVTIIEAKRDFGTGVSSRSSEVIHAGIYYPQNTLKAEFCVRGKALLYHYCREQQINHSRIGKLIVATEKKELAVLRNYREQATKNGVDDLQLIGGQELREMEPEVEALAGVLSPSTGIVDTHQLMLSFLTDISQCNGTIVFNSSLTAGRLTSSGPIIELDGDNNSQYSCQLLINAAGLDAQSVARKLGLQESLIPPLYYAKGYYFSLTGTAPFNRLIYPVANNAGLGIHATLDLTGQLRFGPDIQWIKKVDFTFDEERRTQFEQAIKRYYPGLDKSRLAPGYAGIRPKLVGPREAAADFLLQTEQEHHSPGLINLFGIESPGLTSSMALAAHLVNNISR
jgi:L-2-hydroxyglutarate oxidase LhgO